MWELFKTIDAKIMTAGGGIMLAGGLAYTLFKVLTNDLTHLNAAIINNTEANQIFREKIIEVVGANTEIIRANTEVLRYFKDKR